LAGAKLTVKLSIATVETVPTKFGYPVEVTVKFTLSVDIVPPVETPALQVFPVMTSDSSRGVADAAETMTVLNSAVPPPVPPPQDDSIRKEHKSSSLDTKYLFMKISLLN